MRRIRKARRLRRNSIKQVCSTESHSLSYKGTWGELEFLTFQSLIFRTRGLESRLSWDDNWIAKKIFTSGARYLPQKLELLTLQYFSSISVNKSAPVNFAEIIIGSHIPSRLNMPIIHIFQRINWWNFI